jgi:hypothetical protein
MARFDAVLIPGGGLRPDGSLPAWVERRVEAALQVDGDPYLVFLSAGTAHHPARLDEHHRILFESVAAAHHALARGADARRILTETASWDTVGNAWFSRRLHVEPRQWKKLLVITSLFHLPRTEFVFRWVYGLEPAHGWELEFQGTPDVGMSAEALAARRAHEESRVEAMKGLAPRIRTVEEFHAWLYSEHDLYAVPLRPQPLAGPVLETY